VASIITTWRGYTIHFLWHGHTTGEDFLYLVLLYIPSRKLTSIKPGEIPLLSTEMNLTLCQAVSNINPQRA